MKLKKTYLWSLLLCCSSFAYAQTPASESLAVPPEPGAAILDPNFETVDQGSPAGDYDTNYAQSDSRVFGFSFYNRGGNPILSTPDADDGGGPNREWSFDYNNRAAQDIHMEITDQPNAYTSQLMYSDFYFFPRKNLPAIQWPTDPAITQFTVVLPTGETVTFDKNTKMVTGGVLKESRPVDLNQDRTQRKFAGINYTGTGIMIRVDAQGNMPQLSKIAIISQGSKTCKIAPSKLFDQNGDHWPVFLFQSDDDFRPFLKKACGMTF